MVNSIRLQGQADWNQGDKRNKARCCMIALGLGWGAYAWWTAGVVPELVGLVGQNGNDEKTQGKVSGMGWSSAGWEDVVCKAGGSMERDKVKAIRRFMIKINGVQWCRWADGSGWFWQW